MDPRLPKTQLIKRFTKNSNNKNSEAKKKTDALQLTSIEVEPLIIRRVGENFPS